MRFDFSQEYILEDDYDSKEDEFDLNDYLQDDEIPSYKTATSNQ